MIMFILYTDYFILDSEYYGFASMSLVAAEPPNFLRNAHSLPEVLISIINNDSSSSNCLRKKRSWKRKYEG